MKPKEVPVQLSITLFFIILFTFVSFAQDFRWAENEAVWHHSYLYMGYGYQKTTYAEDVVYEGKLCQKLNVVWQYSFPLPPGEGWYLSQVAPHSTYYVYKSNDSVFVYRNNAFQLAFKTDAQAGDIWDLGTYDVDATFTSNRGYVKVDSVYYQEYNGISLRNIRVHACDEFGDEITGYQEVQADPNLIVDSLIKVTFTLINEKFGYLDGFGFANYVSYYTPHSTIISDERQPQHLLCYESAVFPFYIKSGEEDCFYHTFDNVASLDELELSQIKVYPNPSKNAVFFENLPAGGNMQVFNLQQQLIFQSDFTETTTTIDVSHFASGMYFVQVSNSNGEKETGLKFVKE